MLGDIKSGRVIVVKGFLFLLLGLLSAVFLVLRSPEWQTAALLVLSLWAFCRFYYFAFYVIEKYVDSDFRFSGLISFVVYAMKKRNG